MEYIKMSQRFNYRRAVDHAHLFMWILKDLAWTRCWPIPVSITIVIIANVFAAAQIVMDFLLMYKYKNLTITNWKEATEDDNSGKLQSYEEDAVEDVTPNMFYKAKRELVQNASVSFWNSVALQLWLLGNSFWCVYEVYDLRVSADYLDYYEKGLGIAMNIFYLTVSLCGLYFVFTIASETFGFLGARERRHHDAILTLMDEFDDGILRRDSPEIINVLNYNSFIDSLKMPWDCMLSITKRNGTGLIFFPHESTGKRELKLVPDYWSFTSMENLIICAWVCKDMGWGAEELEYAGLLWVFAVGITMWVAWKLVVFTSAAPVTHSAEIINSVCCFFWVFANTIWGFGEMFLEDGLEGEDILEIQELSPQQRFEIIIPSLFTTDIQAEGAWYTRFIASWMLTSMAVILAIFYIIKLFQRLFCTSGIKRDGNKKARSDRNVNIARIESSE